MASKRTSFVTALSTAILGGSNTDEDMKEESSTAFMIDENDGIGQAITDVLQANLEKIPDDSLIKITHQLEFWRSQQKEHALSKEDLVDLTQRLVHAATWRSRLEDENAFRVPKVRFGRTEIQMPIITCGGMRLQQTWCPDNIPILSPNHNSVLAGDSQKNLKAVVECCIKLGLNHFETARMYGTSELQFIDALLALMEEGTIKREDFIFQTKVAPGKTFHDFEQKFKASWDHVQKLGYIDLFSFHCVSKDSEVDFVLDEAEGGCYAFIKSLQAQGKIKHIGFSTHGTAETIMRMVNSNLFSYVNIHCHFFGSYHGEGTPDTKGGHGNLACVRRAKILDMGVFQISPFDKGGKLYKPSATVAKAIGHQLTPIGFAALHSWKTLGFHTVSVGLARPSDLDEVLEAACGFQNEKVLNYLEQAEVKLRNIAKEKLGTEWCEKGLVNLPSCYQKNTNGIAIGHILWLHNVCSAYGMFEFAKERYANLESAPWDDSKSYEANLEKMSGGNSGRGFQPDQDFTDVLKDHYNPELAKEKIAETHRWLKKGSKETFTQEERTAMGWEEAYSLTVWEEFAGDPSFISPAKVILQNLSGGWFGINNSRDRKQSLSKAKSLRSSIRSSFASTS